MQLYTGLILYFEILYKLNINFVIHAGICSIDENITLLLLSGYCAVIITLTDKTSHLPLDSWTSYIFILICHCHVFFCKKDIYYPSVHTRKKGSGNFPDVSYFSLFGLFFSFSSPNLRAKKLGLYKF